ncbi:glycosyltransferase family 4 protein [Alternaria burnsii]|uniref:Phosphatidylinositol N-acetylglucosaminyltransferase GPI3 subunit n=1 Tax=Alternaria burnsii TaxID=1187904 RepID=A0A8H7ENS3_9PLEO|nr:glycosyltransferase family 4 protein [Alternaria burnsii]KAF7682403.1 glycosyltransferase family 4 protein [Alternaria burnsii]
MPYNIAYVLDPDPASCQELTRNSMVSDNFYPQPDRGHKVIVITHAYNGRKGVRYLTNGLKVYYVPFWVIYRETTFPTVFSFFPIFRNIVIRERIGIVHGHASLSSLCHEAILHARTMGLRTVFTDHSLFGFADAGSILTNKLLKFTLSDVDHVICVSHTCKENTVLRASLDPLMVSVIPNAVVAENFRPLSHDVVDARHMKAPGPRQPMDPDETITVIVIQRLYYNKGTDLLVAAIPHIVAANPNVRFIIAGNGPKAIDLEQMIERNVLQDKVLMIGPVRHEEVRDVMVRGHIYLCPSLTEAFGTVIVEAASCGLYVVATRVGGIPEVLPTHMVEFAAPEEDELVEATGRAIAKLRAGKVRTELFHNQVKQMYSWTDIAQRTERVYDGISGVISHSDFNQGAGAAGAWSATRGRAGVQSFALIERLKRYFGCGIWAGKLFCICVIVDYLIYLLLEMFAPRSRIDICKDWPKKISQAKQESGKRLVVDMDADKGTLLRKRSSRYRKSKREQLEDS